MCDDTLDHSRRQLLKLAALFGLSGSLPLLDVMSARAAAEPNAPVRIGYLPITDATPLLVAHGRGLFEAEGLQAEAPRMFRSWAQLVEAFIAGQVNVVHLLSPMTVWSRFGGRVPAKVVAWNHVNGSALTVAPNIGDLGQLAGKTIAVPFWFSIHNVVLQHLLRSRGLEVISKGESIGPKQVKLVVMAPSDMPPALAANRIAGYIVAEPFNALAESMKVGKILRFTGDVWKDHACCVVFMHERDLTERAAWSQSVVNALVKAQLWTKQHRAEAATLLSKDDAHHYTPHAADVLARVLAPQTSDWDAYKAKGARVNQSWNDQRIDFQPYPFPSYTEELIKRLQQTVVEGDASFLAKLDAKQAAGDLVDDRFVKRALEGVGGLKAFGFPDGFARSELVGS
jgi:NitT/TauT family transport system substrate-binding protein